jgi:hypothetical protein
MLLRGFILAIAFTMVSAIPASAALSFQFNYVDDASGAFASRGWLDPNSLFQQNTRAAAELWGAQFNSNQTIVVRVDTTSYAARAGGSNSLGRLLFTNEAGKEAWEAGPLTRILTGENPGEDSLGYDIVLGFDVSFVESNYWFDPQPELRSVEVPDNRGDFVTVVLHEFGHGFGMTGFRDFNTGEIHGNVVTQFDNLSYYGGDGTPFDPGGDPNPMFFDGALAASVYGSDLPLTHKPAGDLNYSQNFYHLSACHPAAPDGLEMTLMNGCVLPNGSRLSITPIDRAVYGDLGYPLTSLAPADLNRNGRVDKFDLSLWKMRFGSSGADVDDDGDSDGSDFLLWQRSLGFSSTPSTLPAPEPPTEILTVAACAGLGASLHRRSHSRAS